MDHCSLCRALPWFPIWRAAIRAVALRLPALLAQTGTLSNFRSKSLTLLRDFAGEVMTWHAIRGKGATSKAHAADSKARSIAPTKRGGADHDEQLGPAHPVEISGIRKCGSGGRDGLRA